MSEIVKRPWVKSTPTIDAVLKALGPFAAEAGVRMIITSGLRAPLDQLRVVSGYAYENHIFFPEFAAHDVHKRVTIPELGRELYAWQRTWSALLRNVGPEDPGIVINPPLAAECLDDYIRPDGSNAKGLIIPGTPHGTGKCFDEQADGNLKDQIDEVHMKIAVLEKAKASGVAIKGWRIERKNNAIHVDCV